MGTTVAIIVKDVAYIVECVEDFDDAERLAIRCAKKTGKRLYVDMASHLPSTPWVVWCDEPFRVAASTSASHKVLKTTYSSLVKDFDTTRSNVYNPPLTAL